MLWTQKHRYRTHAHDHLSVAGPQPSQTELGVNQQDQHQYPQFVPLEKASRELALPRDAEGRDFVLGSPLQGKGPVVLADLLAVCPFRIWQTRKNGERGRTAEDEMHSETEVDQGGLFQSLDDSSRDQKTVTYIRETLSHV